MSGPASERMRAALDWDGPLHFRQGAKQRLRGIAVYYDFAWADRFVDRRVQFKNGQCLADQVIADCPAGKRPALLLSDSPHVEEGARETTTHYVLVVDLPRYLELANGNAAAAYLAQRLGRGLTRATGFAELVDSADDDELAQWLGDRLDRNILSCWADESEERLALLRAVGGRDESAHVADAEQLVAALDALESLEPQVAEAVSRLITPEMDVEARNELLWSLTSDHEGRLLAGEVLHTRSFDRLADARDAADRFDELLETGGETELQIFLENHPWLLGLDYAQVRPRQAVPRGAVDFLLERFDGFHDLLELKGPDDRVFEADRKGSRIRSPSGHQLSRPLALALAQVHAYLDVLRHDVVTEELFGLPHTRDPEVTILIGRASALSEQERRLLRELNKSLHRVAIVPFDVLAARARAVLDNVERYLLAAADDGQGSDAGVND